MRGLVIRKFLLVQGNCSIKCPFQSSKGLGLYQLTPVVANKVLSIVNQVQHRPIHVLSPFSTYHRKLDEVKYQIFTTTSSFSN